MQVLAYGAVAAAAPSYVGSQALKVLEGMLYSVEVDSTRHPLLFESLLEYLEQDAKKNCQNLALADRPNPDRPLQRDIYYTIGYGAQVVKIVVGGQVGEMGVRRERLAQNGGGEQIILQSKDNQTLFRFVEAVEKKLTEKGRGKLHIYTARIGTDSAWINIAHMDRRSMDSIFLAGDALRFSKDLKRFLNNDYRKRFKLLGAPYRRGYLIYGPPGSGKTSTIEALAAENEMPLCIVNVGDRRLDDISFQELISVAPPRAMILLEDVDRLLGQLDNASNGSLSVSGLLNAVDGAMTRENIVFVFTGNNVEMIKRNAALVRVGRIDLELRFDSATAAQVCGLFQRAFASTSSVPVDAERVRAAMSKLKQKGISLSMSQVAKFSVDNDWLEDAMVDLETFGDSADDNNNYESLPVVTPATRRLLQTYNKEGQQGIVTEFFCDKPLPQNGVLEDDDGTTTDEESLFEALAPIYGLSALQLRYRVSEFAATVVAPVAAKNNKKKRKRIDDNGEDVDEEDKAAEAGKEAKGKAAEKHPAADLITWKGLAPSSFAALVLTADYCTSLPPIYVCAFVDGISGYREFGSQDAVLKVALLYRQTEFSSRFARLSFPSSQQ